MVWISLVSVQFAKAYCIDGDSIFDLLRRFTPVKDGYLVYGSTRSFGAGKGDACLMKVRIDGSVWWAKAYGGSYAERFYAAVQVSDSAYLVAGETYSFGFGNGDLLLLKVKADGSVEWARVYGGGASDRAVSITRAQDGKFYILGETHSFGAGDRDILIMKVDSNGQVLWARVFGGDTAEAAYKIISISDGGCLACCGTWSFGFGDLDMLLIKLDSNGTLEWAEAVGGPDMDYAFSATETGDGFIVVGSSRSYGAGNSDILLLKIDGAGVLEWAKTYGRADVEHGEDVAQMPGGRFFITGHYESTSSLRTLVVFEVDSVGTLRWFKTFGEYMDWGWGIYALPDGSIAAGGDGYRGACSDWVFLLLVFPPDGVYENCLFAETPTETPCSPSVQTLNLGAECLILEDTVSLTISEVPVVVSDECASLSLSDNPKRERELERVFPVVGGVLILSPPNSIVEAFSIDGRLVDRFITRSEKEHRSLERGGVYLWRINGRFVGKTVLR